jgi:hypothetical protein
MVHCAYSVYSLNSSSCEDFSGFDSIDSLGQVCIIETFLADQGLGVSFTTATVTNNGLRAGDKKVLIKEGNFLANAFVYEGKPGIYEYAHPRPLSNPAATDYLRNERKVVEQFNQAGCISSLPE